MLKATSSKLLVCLRSRHSVITSAVDELNALDGVKSDASGKLLKRAIDINQLENLSVSFPGQDMQLEVNDEIVLRYLALYVKTYKLVHPIVVAAVGMWNVVQSLIKSDCDELVAFVLKRKE